MCYEGSEGDTIRLFKQNTVETVVQLINQNAKAKHHVNIGVDAEDYYRIKDSEKKKGRYRKYCMCANMTHNNQDDVIV